MKQSALIAMLVVTGVSNIAHAADAPKPTFEQQYGVILERNPFLKDRVQPRSMDDVRRERDRDRERRPVRTAAQSLVLRGVTIEDAQLHAYFEDARSNTAVRVGPGDVLGDGRVVDIAIDAVTYEQAGKSVWVEVGQNLTGGHAEVVADASTPATGPAASGAPHGVTPPPLPPGDSIAERMKARRAQLKGGNK